MTLVEGARNSSLVSTHQPSRCKALAVGLSGSWLARRGMRGSSQDASRGTNRPHEACRSHGCLRIPLEASIPKGLSKLLGQHSRAPLLAVIPVSSHTNV